MKFIVIETTYPNLQQAKNLAEILLKNKFAACVQFQRIESTYVWEGKIENSHEILVSIKTISSFFDEIEKIIKKHHSYETPQIIATVINQGSKDYLEWVEKSLA